MSSIRYIFILQRLATLLAVSILTLSLSAAVTGVLLAFNYDPSAGGAYASIKQILTEVPNGSLIKDLHDISGNGLIAVSLAQIVVMFLGRQFRRSWLVAWIAGVTLTLTAIALAWTAMILDWTQLGYWRLSIELGTIEAIPLIGSQLREILTGGGAIATATVERLYTIHSYLLPGGAILLSVIHLGGLLLQEQAQHSAKITETLPAEASVVPQDAKQESEAQVSVSAAEDLSL
ncbi:MAG TPA: cytochrome b N-terminal domain-containing protein [Candidatus Caenarcaniphilales bacterium]